MITYTSAKTLAARLSELRHSRGWSMRELSRRAGVSVSTVSNHESCVGAATLSMIDGYAQAFGVGPWQLLYPLHESEEDR